ncbi:MAG TPA: hypothetical protein VK506_15010 [Conexibacter sp.]|nr:hypothetical protein [Conexibacter sp.]
MGASLTASAPPRARRTRLAELAPFAALALWTIAVTVVLARIGVENRYVFRDEANAILLGRDIVRDLSFAVDGTVARGPERMTSLLAALAAWLTDSPTRQVELLHLWTALAQGLVTIPVWLAARELGLGRWQSLAPAAVASSGSFAFYGILTLNTAVGLLTASLLLWAMVRALRRPGLASDALVLGTLALTVLARIGWAPLVVALAPAALATTWFSRPPQERASAWLRQLPGRLLRRHPLLAPAAIAVVLVALVAGPSSLLGGEQYGGIRLTPDFLPSLVWDNTRTLLAHLAIGVAIVPLVLALPLLARALVRPADALEGGYAWLVLGLLVAFSYAYYASMNEDRYFAVLAPPLVLAGALAVFRRPPPTWSVLVSGVLVVLLLGTSASTLTDPIYGYFVAPTWRFLDDAVLRRLALALPDDRDLLAALVALVAALAALLVAWIVRRPRPLERAAIAAAGIVLAGVLAFQLVAMDHPARKLTERVGMRGLSADALEFVDRAGDGGVVRPLAVDSVMDPDLSAQLQILQAYNSTFTGPYFVGRRANPAIPIDALIDWRSGAVAVSKPPPDVLLQIAGAAPVGFAGTVLPPSPHFPWAQMIRLDQPLRATWVMRGMQADRYPLGGTPVELRVFANDAPDRCVTGQVFAHPTQQRPARYRLAGGGRVVRDLVRPTEPATFVRPLDPRRPVTFTLSGEAGRGADGISRSPTLYDVRIVRCPHER